MAIDYNTSARQRGVGIPNVANSGAGSAGTAAAGSAAVSGDDSAAQDSDLLEIIREAERSHQAHANPRLSGWERAYRAFHSQHQTSSKYYTKNYANRSKIFYPKTRAAIRGKQVAAAQALFSTDEVVKIAPERDDDELQRMAAYVLNEVLNYRLDRKSTKGGIPWFRICMGAVQDAMQTGVVASKQFWEYETRIDHTPQWEEAIGADGKPITEADTGEPMFVDTGPSTTRVVKDRPMIVPLPPENCIVDDAAPYYDVVQGGAFFCARWPMTVIAAKRMIQANAEKNGERRIQWREVTDQQLQSVVEGYDEKGVRLARDPNRQDPKDANRRRSGNYAVVWLHENFVQTDEGDMCFWSLGTELVISDPIPTEEAYPEQHGERPYVFGFGAIEAHTVYPQAPAVSWQGLQQEVNDLRNLRLDAGKQAVLPIFKARRGRVVDVSVLSRLSTGSHIQVQDMDDIEPMTIPSGAAQLFRDTSNLESDLDELVGRFSNSAVMNNRTMNETVGGMNIMAGDSNSVQEYDLRVLVETWAEPTLRQVVRCLQYWESDQTVIAVAGARARIWDKFGIRPDLFPAELLETEVSTSVNVGIGSIDPMRRLSKLRVGIELLMPILQASEPQVSVNAEEAISEVMGAIGYKDGRRFFNWPDDEGEGATGPEQQDPEAAAMQAEAEAAMAKAKIDAESRIHVAQIGAETDLQREQIQARTDLEVARMQARTKIQEAFMRMRADTGAKRDATAAQERTGRFSALVRGAAQAAVAKQRGDDSKKKATQ